MEQLLADLSLLLRCHLILESIDQSLGACCWSHLNLHPHDNAQKQENPWDDCEYGAIYRRELTAVIVFA